MKFNFTKNLVIIEVVMVHQVYKFLVDTASEKSFLTPKKNLIKYESLLQKKIKVKGVGKDTIISSAYYIPQIMIDNKVIFKTEFLKKNKNLMFWYLNIDGIIGWDILKRFDFVIDFKNKIFSTDYFRPLKVLASVPIVSDKQLIVNVFYRNKVFKALIDLGANQSTVSTELLSNQEITKKRKSFVIGINGIAFQKNLEVERIPIGFGNIQLNLKNSLARFNNFNYLVKLGLDHFRQNKIFFKNSENEVNILE